MRFSPRGDRVLAVGPVGSGSYPHYARFQAVAFSYTLGILAHVLLMKAYIEGIIKIHDTNSFNDAKTGQTVTYNSYVVQGEGESIKLNSKNDYGNMVDKSAVLTLDIKSLYDAPTKFRVSIIDVKPA